MNISDIKIGDTITPIMGLQLANYFGMDYIYDRIKANPMAYGDFIFDGASCLPDRLVAFLMGISPKCFTYLCALPHDIGYAYGEIRNVTERKRVDLDFKSNLITKCSMPKMLASIFYRAVRIGGVAIFGTSFSWGFAKNK